MLSSLANTAVKNKKIAPMMESFFTAFVLPEFKSPHGFLRYRVSESKRDGRHGPKQAVMANFQPSTGLRGCREVRVLRYEVGQARGSSSPSSLSLPVLRSLYSMPRRTWRSLFAPSWSASPIPTSPSAFKPPSPSPNSCATRTFALAWCPTSAGSFRVRSSQASRMRGISLTSSTPSRASQAVERGRFGRFDQHYSVPRFRVPGRGRALRRRANSVPRASFSHSLSYLANQRRRDQTDSFSRLVRESLEARERTGDNLDYDDEKMLVQMNILKTIDQLTSSLDGTELIAKVEAIIAPALEVTLRNDLVGELQRR